MRLFARFGEETALTWCAFITLRERAFSNVWFCAKRMDTWTSARKLGLVAAFVQKRKEEKHGWRDYVGICKYILRKDPLRRFLRSIVSLSSVLNENFETFARSSLLLSAFSVRLNDHGDRLAAALGADRSNRWHCEPQLVPKCVAAGT